MSPIFITISCFIGVACLVGGLATYFMRSAINPALEERLDNLIGSGASSAKAKSKQEASLLAEALDDGPGFLEDIFHRFFDLRSFLKQADCPLAPSRFILCSLGLAGFGVFIMPVCRVPVMFAPAGAVLGLVPFAYFFWQRKRRLTAFSRQLPDALDLVSRALRAGHSLASGFKLVSEEMQPPIAIEFGRAYEAQNLGQPLDKAIEEITERVPNLDLRFFATAVILQRQTGGDLAEILDKIGHLIRERFRIHGQIQALTGEGRLSGVVLLALPPVLAVVMMFLNPKYMMQLFTDPMGQQMLAGGIVMQVLGAWVIRKIVNIKV
jgi:tight adherence protein B